MKTSLKENIIKWFDLILGSTSNNASAHYFDRYNIAPIPDSRPNKMHTPSQVAVRTVTFKALFLFDCNDANMWKCFEQNCELPSNEDSYLNLYGLSSVAEDADMIKRIKILNPKFKSASNPDKCLEVLVQAVNQLQFKYNKLQHYKVWNNFYHVKWNKLNCHFINKDTRLWSHVCWRGGV